MRYNSGGQQLTVAVLEMLFRQQQAMAASRRKSCTMLDNCQGHFSLKDN